MPYNFKNANLAVRENRLGSITGFTGDLETLVYRSECGSLKNRERCFSQSSSCLSGCALNALAAIRNVAVVYHAPAGCTAMASNDSVKFGQIAARINELNNVLARLDWKLEGYENRLMKCEEKLRCKKETKETKQEEKGERIK